VCWSRKAGAGLLGVALAACGPSQQEVDDARSATAQHGEHIGRIEFQLQQCQQNMTELTARVQRLEADGAQDSSDPAAAPLPPRPLEEAARVAATAPKRAGRPTRKFPTRIGGMPFRAGRDEIRAACQGGVTQSMAGELGCVYPAAPVGIKKRGSPLWVVFLNDRAQEMYFEVGDHDRAKERLSLRYGDAMGEEDTVVWKAVGGTIILMREASGSVVVYLSDAALEARTRGY
jgi:hypothetical protein